MVQESTGNPPVREIQMKPIKMFGLAALAALMAMVVIGAPSASAEVTGLCAEDASPCGSAVTHVHEISVGHAKLLSSFATVECEALFLGEVVEEGAPLIIEGTFTYRKTFKPEVAGDPMTRR
jgi:hypothetical protein